MVENATPPPVFLRQTVDQLGAAKPPLNYEVVTPSRTWRPKPGEFNVLEAFCIFLHELKRVQYVPHVLDALLQEHYEQCNAGDDFIPVASRRKLRKDRPVGAHVGVLQSVPAPLAASKGRSRPSSPNV